VITEILSNARVLLVSGEALQLNGLKVYEICIANNSRKANGLLNQTPQLIYLNN
jgi:hypothetical protein